MFPCTATSLGSLEEELKGAERVIKVELKKLLSLTVHSHAAVCMIG
jgi:hypothetical protein